ncbi:MAG: hypothetical protein WAK31_27555 [Chthoniobacterales bacterium]
MIESASPSVDNITGRPIRDIYGIVETPDTAGLIDPGDAAGVRSALNERSQGGMP